MAGKKKNLATSSKRVAKKAAKGSVAKAAKGSVAKGAKGSVAKGAKGSVAKGAKGSVAKAAKKPAAKTAASSPKKRAAKHEIVHWEIQSRAPERLHSFYADALGWEIDTNNPMRYGMVASGGPQGIDGGIGGTQGTSSRVLVYAAVPSIPLVLERIESLGGKTLMPRTDIGPVIMALYEDPEGNAMGLIEG
jgi:predicted enzyme related to lactoylglutathione lyase